MTVAIDKLERYADGFERFADARSDREPGWLIDRRRGAMARFTELGFPTTHHEDWRWTNIAELTRSAARRPDAPPTTMPSPETIARYTFGGLPSALLVFVNGHFIQSLSVMPALPEGVTVTNLAAALSNGSGELVRARMGELGLADDRAFIALNAAFMSDGAFVHLAPGVTLDTPIHVLCLTDVAGGPVVSHPRHLVVAGAGSRATIIESYAGSGVGTCVTNPVTEVICEEKARLVHTRVQRESEEAFHIGALTVHQLGGSRYTGTGVNLGGRLVRNEAHVRLDGEHADCTLYGLSLGHRQQLIDNHTRFDHAKPHCESHQVFKSILDDRSRGVFDGRILVRRDAQKTDAKQTARALLLSDDAISNNKPQLEIYADDVKCTHGATTGQLDDSQIFYLRARGLDLDAARTLLTYAFACDVANHIDIEAVRNDIQHDLLERLPMGELIKGAV